MFISCFNSYFKFVYFHRVCSTWDIWRPVFKAVCWCLGTTPHWAKEEHGPLCPKMAVQGHQPLSVVIRASKLPHRCKFEQMSCNWRACIHIYVCNGPTCCLEDAAKNAQLHSRRLNGIRLMGNRVSKPSGLNVPKDYAMLLMIFVLPASLHLFMAVMLNDTNHLLLLNCCKLKTAHQGG